MRKSVSQSMNEWVRRCVNRCLHVYRCVELNCYMVEERLTRETYTTDTDMSCIRIYSLEVGDAALYVCMYVCMYVCKM